MHDDWRGKGRRGRPCHLFPCLSLIVAWMLNMPSFLCLCATLCHQKHRCDRQLRLQTRSEDDRASRAQRRVQSKSESNVVSYSLANANVSFSVLLLSSCAFATLKPLR